VHDYWDLAKAENKNALLRTLGEGANLLSNFVDMESKYYIFSIKRLIFMRFQQSRKKDAILTA